MTDYIFIPVTLLNNNNANEGKLLWNKICQTNLIIPSKKNATEVLQQNRLCVFVDFVKVRKLCPLFHKSY